MPASGKVYEDNLEQFKSPLFGDQNILAPYYETVKQMPGHTADKYGEEILSKWRKVAGEGVTNNRSYDEVLSDFIKEVKNSFPELKFD